LFLVEGAVLEWRSMKVAVVDLGLHAIYLAVATASATGKIALLGDYVQDTVLGSGLGTGGPVEKDTIEQALKVVRSYRHIIRQQAAAERVRVVASPALCARPGFASLAEKVQATLDVPVESLAGPDEAAYMFLGAYDTVPPRAGTCLVTAHVGTETTSVTVGEGQRIVDFLTLETGLVTLTQEFVDAPHPTPEQCLALSEHLNEAIDLTSIRRHVGRRPMTLIAAGRPVTTLTTLTRGRPEIERTTLHGSRLSLETVYEWYELLARTPVGQRSEFPGLPLSLAKGILAGVGILLFVMDKLESTEVVVSAGGLRHGMLREMLGIDLPFE